MNPHESECYEPDCNVCRAMENAIKKATVVKKHISEVELCDAYHGRYCCNGYHRDDFCLLCGYELEGDRLYMEIHGKNGWSDAVTEIDSRQPYVCMKCVRNFYYPRPLNDSKYLINFIKKKK